MALPFLCLFLTSKPVIKIQPRSYEVLRVATLEFFANEEKIYIFAKLAAFYQYRFFFQHRFFFQDYRSLDRFPVCDQSP